MAETFDRGQLAEPLHRGQKMLMELKPVMMQELHLETPHLYSMVESESLEACAAEEEESEAAASAEVPDTPASLTPSAMRAVRVQDLE